MALLQKLRAPLMRSAGPARILAAAYHEKVSVDSCDYFSRYASVGAENRFLIMISGWCVLSGLVGNHNLFCLSGARPL